MRTSEVLNKAADLIEQRGWGQRDWGVHNEGAPLCLEGGIVAALGLDADADAAHVISTELPACPAYQAVMDYVRPRIAQERPSVPESKMRLYTFNDTEGRTAAEVVEVLRAAAVIEQVKEQQDAPAAAEPVSA